MFSAETKQIESQTVAFVTMHGSYDQIPDAYGRLYGWLAQHGIAPEGMPQAVYLTDPASVPLDQSVYELWAPVSAEQPEVPADEDGIGIKVVPAMLVAAAMHVGPYETVDATYTSLWAWIAGQGYAPAGPPAEVYFSDPADTRPEDYLTEVRIPVGKP